MLEIESELSALVATDDYEADMSMMYELVEKFESEASPFELVGPILRFFEVHHETCFGAPGPLVHFMERYYRSGYEEALCASFSRRPTRQTALMMNRLINGSTGEKKLEYLRLLSDAIRRDDIDRNTTDEVSRFLALHTK